jgi:Protein of unknown function (DUF3592)
MRAWTPTICPAFNYHCSPVPLALMDTAFAIFLAIVAAFLGGTFIGFMLGLSKGVAMGLHIRADHPLSPLPWIMCFIGAGIFLLAALSSFFYSVYFLANSTQTMAVVTEIRESKDNEGGVSQSPVYAYTDATGQKFTGSPSASGGWEFKPGDSISIRYLTNSPHQSRIDGFVHHWMLPLLMGFFSIGIGGFGVALRWWRARDLKWAEQRARSLAELCPPLETPSS